MSHIKDFAIDKMNDDVERLLWDIHDSLRRTRWENTYVTIDRLAETIKDALGDDAQLVAKKILNGV